MIWLDFFFLSDGFNIYIYIFHNSQTRDELTSTRAVGSRDSMSSYFLQELTCQLTCQATSCKNASVWSVAQMTTRSLVLLNYVSRHECRVESGELGRII